LWPSSHAQIERRGSGAASSVESKAVALERALAGDEETTKEAHGAHEVRMALHSSPR